MRSYKRTIEKWILSLVMICLMVGSGAMDVFAAGYDDPVSVVIPYTHIYDADGNRKNDTFNYTITPLDGAPAPAGSTNGVYAFSVKGTPEAVADLDDVKLNITFERPGDYQYRVASSDAKKKGFTYESRMYTVHVYVQNDSEGKLKAPLVTAVGADGRKYQRLQLNPSHAAEKLPANRVRPTTTPQGDGMVAEPATEDIKDDPTPLDNLVEKVVPKVDPERHYWALLNLISAILTTLLSAIMAYRYFERVDTEDDEYIIRRKGNLRLAGIVLSIVSIVVFILTEDLTNPMGWVDEWTLFMLCVLAADIVLAFVVYKKYGDESEEGQAA